MIRYTSIKLLLLLIATTAVWARPMVRNIRSTNEFDRLLEKHGKETGLPVVVDFYSDGCGPCRMMAPIFKKMAGQFGQDKVVFVKVDTNVQRELAGRYRITSLPTFVFFLEGRKFNQFSGAGEGQLRQMTQQVIRQSEIDNVKLDISDLTSYYKDVEPSKTEDDIEKVYKKCVDMQKGKDKKDCVGASANQLSRRLKKKYGSVPKLQERFDAEARNPSKGKAEGNESKNEQKSSRASSSSTSAPTNNKQVPNLHLATEEQLLEELEKRKAEEEEDDDEEELFPLYGGVGDFPERVVIVGGGPAGLSAAIYAARAGLQPVVVAPMLGGQLQGKGVVVENFPGIFSREQEWMGPDVVLGMKRQASAYGAVFEHGFVQQVDATQRPFRITTQKEFDNSTDPQVIATHSIIVATGAESNWLGISGEQELRGGGVSSCATCDGNLYKGKDVLVVGGGDAAMEDALVLARTSKSVKVIHRRDTFRASKVLAQRVLEHSNIEVLWNTVVTEIVGKAVPQESGSDDDDVNLDEEPMKIVDSVQLRNTQTDETSTLSTDAVFVAIGHTPTTKFLQGIVEFDPNHDGYVKVQGDGSTRTSVDGIFAAGDVSDAIYRQAITSAGSGAAAALDAERWLSEEGLGNEAAELEAELLAELLNDGDNANDSSSYYNAYADASSNNAVGRKESVNSMTSEL